MKSLVWLARHIFGSPHSGSLPFFAILVGNALESVLLGMGNIWIGDG